MKDFNKNISCRIVLFLSLILLLANACKKTEAPLTSTDLPEPGFTLPQGNNDFDQRIMGYYNRWGTSVLYKFTPQEINWKITGFDTFYKSVPAVETYINPQLDLLESTFFKYYADSTLRKYLPVKLFLCSSLIGSGTTQVNSYLTVLTNTNTGGYQSFAVNGGNSNVSTINKTLYKGTVNFGFLRLLDIESKTSKSILFITLNATVPSGTTKPDRYKAGILGSVDGTTLVAANLSTDWHSFIQAIVSNPYTFLTDPATTATDVSAKGILSPVKDANGLIRRKYDAIIKHYKDIYGIDLQRIGDGI